VNTVDVLVSRWLLLNKHILVSSAIISFARDDCFSYAETRIHVLRCACPLSRFSIVARVDTSHCGCLECPTCRSYTDKLWTRSDAPGCSVLPVDEGQCGDATLENAGMADLIAQFGASHCHQKCDRNNDALGVHGKNNSAKIAPRLAPLNTHIPRLFYDVTITGKRAINYYSIAHAHSPESMQPQHTFTAVSAYAPGPFETRKAILRSRVRDAPKAASDPAHQTEQFNETSTEKSFKKRHFPTNDEQESFKRKIHEAIANVAEKVSDEFTKGVADTGRLIALLDSLIQAGDQLETAVAIASYRPFP
jgi:ferredoxin-like protein FixX